MPSTPAAGVLTRTSDATYCVTGHLVFATVRDVLRSSESVFQHEPQFSVDLSGVESADSAGLALLIEWYKVAQKANRSIRFVSTPPQLRALAKISDIEDVLPLV